MNDIMSEYRELLIGCGHDRNVRVSPPNGIIKTGWQSLTTLDSNRECHPDIVFDLRAIARGHWIPFLNGAYRTPDECYNEIHAYEVLEHIGDQGNAECFFAQFKEFWRVLKPNGYFCATVPHWSSLWAWGDPSHTRIINEGTLIFLEREQYEKQLGKTAMSDFRHLMGNMNWKIERCRKQGQLLEFVLRALK